MASFGKAETVNRKVLGAFYRAYAARDIDRLEPLLDDDATWTINGPVDILQFCGSRHGKQAVLDMVARQVPKVFEIAGFVPEIVMIDGDRAATLNRLSGQRADDGRLINYRVAQFITFRNGKIADYCSVIDSFDAAEQVLGHRIEVSESGAARFDNARIGV
jgi:ketosteroid isomerase-like protein